MRVVWTVKTLETLINLQRCLSLLWIKNGKKIPGIQYRSGALKCLVFSLVVKLCGSIHRSFCYTLLLIYMVLQYKKIVILHTVKKITVIIQWITVTESRYLSALTYTIICCVCHRISVQIKVFLVVNSAVFKLTWSEGLYWDSLMKMSWYYQ